MDAPCGLTGSPKQGVPEELAAKQPREAAQTQPMGPKSLLWGPLTLAASARGLLQHLVTQHRRLGAGNQYQK